MYVGILQIPHKITMNKVKLRVLSWKVAKKFVKAHDDRGCVMCVIKLAGATTTTEKKLQAPHTKTWHFMKLRFDAARVRCSLWITTPLRLVKTARVEINESFGTWQPLCSHGIKGSEDSLLCYRSPMPVHILSHLNPLKSLIRCGLKSF